MATSIDNIETLSEDPLCKILRRSLCQEIGTPVYISWFGPTCWKIDDAKLIIETPSAFVHTQISLHFNHLIQRLLPRVNNHVLSCTFVRS